MERSTKDVSPHFLTGNCALSSYDIWPAPSGLLEPSLSPIQRLLQMTTKVPVCADVWILGSFLSCPVICGHGKLVFFPAVYRTLRETGPAEFLDYVLKVLPK